MSDPVIFKLSKPLNTHSGTVSELTLKYPTARSFIKYGVPYASVVERTEESTKEEFRFNAKPMFQFVADMSGLDDIVLSSVAAQDVMPLFYTVLGMLSGGAETSVGGSQRWHVELIQEFLFNEAIKWPPETVAAMRLVELVDYANLA